MRRISLVFFTSIALILLFVSDSARTQVIPPKAQGTSSGGQTIEQAQQEDAMGPKARVAVTKFTDKSAKGYHRIGDGMAEMLANALFNTGRYIVLERQSIDDVLQEQDFGASGRVKQETAAKIGEIEGADLLIEGTITEFEPGSSGAGGGIGGISHGLNVIGGILGGVKSSHLAMIVKVIDARTGRRLASEQVEGKATDIGGMGSLGGYHLAGVFGAYSKTPMEKAIRVAIDESVKLIVAKTPADYFRASAGSSPRTTSSGTTTAPQQTPSGSIIPVQSSSKPQGTEPQIVYVKWPTVSLREGPGMNFKSLAEVSKGTQLSVLEDRGQWLRVGLEDGREGWIGKATTSETP
jgi:curli biogenesis system outer membrane secretion channel CsgG